MEKVTAPLLIFSTGRLVYQSTGKKSVGLLVYPSLSRRESVDCLLDRGHTVGLLTTLDRICHEQKERNRAGAPVANASGSLGNENGTRRTMRKKKKIKFMSILVDR